jgi:hypothetical protein
MSTAIGERPIRGNPHGVARLSVRVSVASSRIALIFSMTSLSWRGAKLYQAGTTRYSRWNPCVPTRPGLPSTIVGYDKEGATKGGGVSPERRQRRTTPRRRAPRGPQDLGVGGVGAPGRERVRSATTPNAGMATVAATAAVGAATTAVAAALTAALAAAALLAMSVLARPWVPAGLAFTRRFARRVKGRPHSLGTNTERGEYVFAGLTRSAAARQQCHTFTRRHGPGK